MKTQNDITSAHDAFKTTTSAVYEGIARLRWPDYQVSGEGRYAVVLHCVRKVILVGYVLEGRQIKSAKCGPACRFDDDARWHRGYALDEQPKETPYRSMHRLPGWDD
jgi:hypothetical protein